MVSENKTAKLAYLAEIYKRFDTPVDSLAINPPKLAEFAAEMNRHGFHWTPEDALQQLFRARKSGNLTKIRRVD